MAQGLLITGTSSDAGKSLVTTAICRALVRRGLRVAPFKAQNMSNNSMVTRDGAEIGRAQWLQAVAARVDPEAAMNPVLLKPGSDLRSHVVVMGRPDGILEAHEYAGGRARLEQAAYAAYDELAGRFDVVVCEGAGSPAEINLRAWDYVNMGLAQHARIPTVLVADIDRGGVFASMFGTVALLDAADQALVGGFVINKFRGDVTLLRPGLDRIEELTGRPVLGVLPWAAGLWLDAEDGVTVESPTTEVSATVGERLRVAVVALPRISNFTDVDALRLEPSLDVQFVRSPAELEGADLVVLPGTRSTIADLDWLRSRGLDAAVASHVHSGRALLGICGGAQMLGRRITDPEGVEGRPGEDVDGLDLAPLHTDFMGDKVLGLRSGTALGVPLSGYVIHHGRITRTGGDEFLDGVRTRHVFATMWHGCLESDEFRRAFLVEVARIADRTDVKLDPQVCFAAAREAMIDQLADALEANVNVAQLITLIEQGPRSDLPVIAPSLRPYADETTDAATDTPTGTVLGRPERTVPG